MSAGVKKFKFNREEAKIVIKYLDSINDLNLK